MFKRRSEYQPPRSYWQEIGRLDDVLSRLGEGVGSEVIRRSTIIDYRTIWVAPDPDQPPRAWLGKRLLDGRRVLGYLVTGQEVESLVGMNNPLKITIHRYSQPIRQLRVMDHMRPDAEHPSVVLPKELEAIEREVASTAVGKEQYDFLLEELSRGASGEFLIQNQF